MLDEQNQDDLQKVQGFETRKQKFRLEEDSKTPVTYTDLASASKSKKRKGLVWIFPLILLIMLISVVGIILYNALSYVNVTFMIDNQIRKELKLNKGSFLGIDEAPAVDVNGFIFTGWYTDENTTDKYDFDKPVTQNLTLYAGLRQAGLITLTVYLNDGSENTYNLTDQHLAQADILNADYINENLSEEFKLNYDLVGFSADPLSTEPEYGIEDKIELYNGTLYAIWQGKQVDVNLSGVAALLIDGNDFEDTVINLSYGSTYIVNSLLFNDIYQAGTGARVSGFYVSVNGGEPVLYTHGQEIVIVNNMEFELAFDGTVNKAVLDFSDITDDIGAEAEYFGVGTTFTFPTLQKTGYTLSGYTIGASQTIMSLNTPIVVGEGVTVIKPHFVPETRTITWVVDGNETTSTLLVDDVLVYTGTEPTRQQTDEFSYSFAGWSLTLGGETIDLSSVVISPTSDNETYKYYAVFNQTVRTYTITWLSQDGLTELEVDENAEYGTTISFDSIAPNKEADAEYIYTFVGWATSTGQESGVEAELLGSVVGNQTYYAAFSKTYTTAIRIYNAEQLKELATLVNNGHAYSAGKEYILMADINLGGAQWTPIGHNPGDYTQAFRGKFNGNGHKISNFVIKQYTQYAGLFGYTFNAEITNLGVTDFVINMAIYDNKNVGAGGLVGHMDKGIITNCYAIGSVYLVHNRNYGAYAGVMVGSSVGISISRSYSKGDCYAVNAFGAIASAGGLLGNSGWESTISNSYSTADVNAEGGGAAAGGLVGHSDVLAVLNCYATGEVTVGGFYSYIGGLVGEIRTGTIINSYATGDITGYTTNVTIKAGGLAGSSYSTAEIINSFRRYNQHFSITIGQDNYSTPSNELGEKFYPYTILSTWFTETLEWSADVWDFTNLNLQGGIHPTLK